MDPSARICDEYDHLLAMGYEHIAVQPIAGQVIFYVVIARCEKDMANFESIFEQALNERELTVLIDGLRKMDESNLADCFADAFKSLKEAGFYPRRDTKGLSEKTKARIAALGNEVGDRLWNLDAKLVALLQAQ